MKPPALQNQNHVLEKPEVDQEFFTIRQLAAFSQIGINVLYRAVKERELAHFVSGSKKIIVQKKDFLRWFDAHKEQSKQESLHCATGN
jgi:hypothetical protein